MKAETWDELWRDNKNRKPWIEPEEGFLDLIPTLKEERVSRTLDLGCGIGRHCIVLAAEGFETYGEEAEQGPPEHVTAGSWHWIIMARKRMHEPK
jgi:2-polyprenyl-3-methyl-5-hydroxy-6-metoxy-1,4-benzoquinol methylase